MGAVVRLRRFVLLPVPVLAVGQTAAAVVCDGIDFPSRDIPFADAEIAHNRYLRGGPAPTDPDYVNPARPRPS